MDIEIEEPADVIETRMLGHANVERRIWILHDICVAVDPSEPADLYCCQHGRLFRLGERGN